MQTIIKKPIRRVLVIHDLCTVGKAALTNILPVLSVMGTEVCPIPTMVLSTHTGGFGKPVSKSLSGFGKSCAEHLKISGFTFDALFLGYLGNRENIEEAREIRKLFPEALVLFDPIMADHGSFYSNFDGEYKESLKVLLDAGTVITPNYTEACFLTGEEYEPVCTMAKLERIWKTFQNMGVKESVITSIPMKEAYAIGIQENDRTQRYSYQMSGRAYPGTGDLFAAVLLGGLLQGKNLFCSVKKAHEFVSQCIFNSDQAGYDTREGVLLEKNLSHLL